MNPYVTGFTMALVASVSAWTLTSMRSRAGSIVHTRNAIVGGMLSAALAFGIPPAVAQGTVTSFDLIVVALISLALAAVMGSLLRFLVNSERLYLDGVDYSERGQVGRTLGARVALVAASMTALILALVLAI